MFLANKVWHIPVHSSDGASNSWAPVSDVDDANDSSHFWEMKITARMKEASVKTMASHLVIALGCMLHSSPVKDAVPLSFRFVLTCASEEVSIRNSFPSSRNFLFYGGVAHRET